MVQILNKYGNTSIDSGNVLVFDKYGKVKLISIAGSGTVTSINTSGPLTGGPITTSGTIGITQSTASTDGYLSAADWNTFNDKPDLVDLEPLMIAYAVALG